ncbi:MAG: FG-GAP repeat protein [Ktedonobacteraceae bacterium]
MNSIKYVTCFAVLFAWTTCMATTTHSASNLASSTARTSSKSAAIVWLPKNFSVPSNISLTSVAISGNVVAAGEPSGNNNEGQVQLLYSANGSWTLDTILTANDGNDNDEFGRSVAISNNTLVIGAPNAPASNSAAGPGETYVFTKNNGTWIQVAELTPSDGKDGDKFGSSVAIFGGTIVVGAPAAKTNESGAAYVYVEPAGGWSGQQTQTTELTQPNPQDYDRFGYSVAVSVDSIVVGSPMLYSTYSGTAYVFAQPSSGWGAQAQLSPTAVLAESNPQVGDEFGAAVAENASSAIVVGAPHHPASNGDFGAAYVYTKPASGWTGTVQPAAILPLPDYSGGGFGASVAISGKNILSTDNSLAYFYQQPSGGWTGHLSPTDSINMYPSVGGYVINELSLSGDDAASVGAGIAVAERFRMSMSYSAPETLPELESFSSQTTLTNNSETTSFPADILLNAPTFVPITSATASSGTCQVDSMGDQAHCDFVSIPGNGGFASATIEMDPSSEIFQLGGTIEQQALFQNASPTLTAGQVTQVTPPSLTINGLSNLTLKTSQSGKESLVIDTSGSPESITVSAHSSNTSLVPDSGITGAGNCITTGSCILIINPVPGETGTTSIAIGVDDDYGAVYGSFTVTVTSQKGGGGGSITPLGLFFLAGLIGLTGVCRRLTPRPLQDRPKP